MKFSSYCTLLLIAITLINCSKSNDPNATPTTPITSTTATSSTITTPVSLTGCRLVKWVSAKSSVYVAQTVSYNDKNQTILIRQDTYRPQSTTATVNYRYTYNADGTLSRLAIMDKTSAGDTLLQQIDLIWQAGKISRMSSKGSSTTVSTYQAIYEEDTLRRYENSSNAAYAKVVFTYDQKGNLSSVARTQPTNERTSDSYHYSSDKEPLSLLNLPFWSGPFELISLYASDQAYYGQYTPGGPLRSGTSYVLAEATRNTKGYVTKAVFNTPTGQRTITYAFENCP